MTIQAARQGVVSILAEAGSNGTLDTADVEIHMRGMRNVMRHLGMIPGEPDTGRASMWSQPANSWSALGGAGSCASRSGSATEIAAGQEIAEVCDLFGEVVERIHVPREGIARLIWAHKAVNTGDPIVKCWIVDQAESASEHRGGVCAGK